MTKHVRNLLLTSLILFGSLIAVSGCANYEDKLVDDAKNSFDISKSKAECLVTVILNRTGWDAERAWDFLEENYEEVIPNSEAVRFANAMESGITSCGINPN